MTRLMCSMKPLVANLRRRTLTAVYVLAIPIMSIDMYLDLERGSSSHDKDRAFYRHGTFDQMSVELSVHQDGTLSYRSMCFVSKGDLDGAVVVRVSSDQLISFK